MSISNYIKEIGRGTKGARSLSREQAADLMGQLLDGQVSDLELGGFCVAMRFKGESAQELAGFLDATEQRLPAWPAATNARPVVVIPSYNGARKLPNFTPLLAALLAREGLPVLVHGCETENGRTSTSAIWQQLGWAQIQNPAALEPGQKVWMQTRHMLPTLERLLQVRRLMGLRNPAHSLVKLLDPVRGATLPSLVLASYTHPDYAHSMAQTLELKSGNALLLRGTEGEAVASPSREPASQGVIAGQIVFTRTALRGEAEPDAAAQKLTAQQTAELTQQILSGQRPIPAPIAVQVQQIKALHTAMASPSPQNTAALLAFNRSEED